MSLFDDADLPAVSQRESRLDFWNQDTFDGVIRQFRSGNMHHAILLLGAEGAGRETLALEIAQWVLCLNRDSLDAACGSCKSCLLFQAGSDMGDEDELGLSHPDYYGLGVEDGKTQIAVDQVRSLIENLNESAHQNGWKLANITEVSALNQSSYNALLKTLEEPQSETLLILQASQLQQVPATIRSRAQLMALNITDQEAVLEWARERNGGLSEELSQAINLFPEAPYQAENFANNGEAQDCMLFINDLADMLEGQAAALDVAQNWQDKIENASLWLQLMMRDLFIWQQTENTELLSLQQLETSIAQIVKNLNNHGLSQLNEKIVELRRLIIRKTPVNLTASWQALMIYMAQLPARQPKAH